MQNNLKGVSRSLLALGCQLTHSGINMDLDKMTLRDILMCKRLFQKQFIPSAYLRMWNELCAGGKSCSRGSGERGIHCTGGQ